MPIKKPGRRQSQGITNAHLDTDSQISSSRRATKWNRFMKIQSSKQKFQT